MAGTPTPNYNFPTYAETDAPNLAGAYNQAVNAIDAKIKEVADAASSGASVPDANSTTKGIAKLYDSTTAGDGNQDDGGITPKAVDDKIGGSLTGYAPKFTATAPVTYSGNKIGIRYSNPSADGSQNGYGAVQVTGKQQDVANADSLTTATVPNVKAVKDYVDAKVPVEQQAYTGTAPITVDNGAHTIGITRGAQIQNTNVDEYISQSREQRNVNLTPVFSVADVDVYNKIVANNDAAHDWPAGYTAPTCTVVNGIIKAATPNASTSERGLVRLTNVLDTRNTNDALTGVSLTFAKGIYDSNSRSLTVADLSQLKVNTATGLVYLNIPASE